MRCNICNKKVGYAHMRHGKYKDTDGLWPFSAGRATTVDGTERILCSHCAWHIWHFTGVIVRLKGFVAVENGKDCYGKFEA